MKRANMQIERTSSDSLVVNKLPDGSRIIVNSGNETVYALNATAGAAWDACSEPATLPQVAERMQQSLEVTVTEEMAEMAVRQLEDNKLVSMPASAVKTTRRQMIGSLSAAAALPLVAALTMSEQRAYAMKSSSPMPTPPPPPKKPNPFPWL
jgi:hypothetical protein